MGLGKPQSWSYEVEGTMLKINLNIWVTDLASFHSKPISITDYKFVVQGAV
jgi:hypothetical protein